MKKKPIQAVSKETGDEATQDKAQVRALKLGLDVHYRQVTVAMQEDGGRIKAAGKMSHEAFLDWVRTKLEECAAPRFFVGTGQDLRRIISWELARGVRGNLTMGGEL
jgi:hypothetical protein